MSTDRRERVLTAAMFSPDLTYAEKVYVFAVATLRPEYVDGERRHGSKAMSPDGRFSLHLDYLAGALNSSPEGVRKTARRLVAKGFLHLLHEGTYGRPNTYQAMVVRGAKNGRVTSGQKGTPYGFAEWFTRVAEKAPLTYRTPDLSDHPPTSGVSPAPTQQVLAATRGECRWHEFTPCPDDCADHPTSRRRSA